MMKISRIVNVIGLRVLPLAFLIVAIDGVSAGTVVVTPGSLAGYTYFPKETSYGGNSGSGGGEDVSTLQRCLYSPNLGDKTVVVNASKLYGYEKDISLYYNIVGGDGGSGVNGGGGGASAILLNGVKVALGTGGNGNSSAVGVSGVFKIKKNDTIRFVTGGGGGAGINHASAAIGGGGGAGYTGGGGGASKNSSIGGTELTAAGRGGGELPGAGGFAVGGMSGTAGIGMQGGVSTWPSGSSAPFGVATGTGSSAYYNQSYYYYNFFSPPSSESLALRHPATANLVGSPNGGMQSGRAFSGGGGALGLAGSIAVSVGPGWCNGSTVNVRTSNDSTYVNDNGGCYTYYNQYMYLRTGISKYEPHTAEMKFTRANPYISGGSSNPITGYSGSFSGQIITDRKSVV